MGKKSSRTSTTSNGERRNVAKSTCKAMRREYMSNSLLRLNNQTKAWLAGKNRRYNMTYKREDIKTVLTENVAEITFTKKDGTERLMKCTLKSDIVPERDVVGVIGKVEEKTRVVNTEVLPVWDIVKSAWRSFRVDSVKAIKVV